MFLGVAPGTPLRTSDVDAWYPTILFDAVYASAVPFWNSKTERRGLNKLDEYFLP